MILSFLIPIVFLIFITAIIVLATNKKIHTSIAQMDVLSFRHKKFETILAESIKKGEIDQVEYQYVRNILNFKHRVAREIMVPRTELVSLTKDASLEQVIQVIKEEGYTRYPIMKGGKDHIIGVVNMKEVLIDCLSNKCDTNQPLIPYIKPVVRMSETIPIHHLLLKIQKERSHMVILYDEYGGTAGLVTIEDILEEIVGDIRDEFDYDEIPLIQKINDHQYIFDAKILISEVNKLLNISLPQENTLTLGGWFLTQKIENIHIGDWMTYEQFTFTIVDLEGHHILYIEAKKTGASSV